MSLPRKLPMSLGATGITSPTPSVSRSTVTNTKGTAPRRVITILLHGPSRGGVCRFGRRPTSRARQVAPDRSRWVRGGWGRKRQGLLAGPCARTVPAAHDVTWLTTLSRLWEWDWPCLLTQRAVCPSYHHYFERERSWEIDFTLGILRSAPPKRR